MSLQSNCPRDWHARLNLKSGKVLCGYERCDGHLGYVGMDEEGHAWVLTLPPGFEPFTRGGIWRLSNYARGRRGDLGQRPRHRRYIANDVMPVGGDQEPQVLIPVRVECPKCWRVNVAEAERLQPPQRIA